MSGAETINKLGVAVSLLNSAIDAYLDRHDYLGAIVLAGSSEDVLHGLLKHDSREEEAARAQQIASMLKIDKLFQGDTATLTEKRAHEVIRRVFNWLRHADRSDDATQITVDLDDEARETIDRAINNLCRAANAFPPRIHDFDKARTAQLRRPPQGT